MKNNKKEPEKQIKQTLPDGNIGKVQSRNLEQEMQESYLAYAMSVIVARALPDVRDGLKPVHRRVLYAMHELGLHSGVKHRKSATVVGDVLGKYHPHGDIAVYDTMVRMAQPFSMRYRLIDGQGNFGSMDGDNAAAMRYTEARLAKISDEILADIEKNTVDFVENYDATRTEPAILPSKIPQLLLNGTLGIAVGMATNIPPHNLAELIDGIVATIDDSEITTEDLMQYIKGPDFPTGGIVFGTDAIKAAYGTGRGKILIRGVAEIEEKKNSRFRIIISEIPYQVNKAELIAKIAELAKAKKIEGIIDLRDESDRKSGVRIVVDLKQNAYPKKVLNKLYQLTNLQIAYHFNMLALVNGIQPKTLTLKDILEEFITHRQVIVTRRTEFELKRAKERAHILEGLKKALDHIDEVIATIKKSETKEVAHKNLMTKFGLSDQQSTAILEMKLSTLAGLERQKINDELAEKIKLIKELTDILGSKAKILTIIKKELAEIKAKYQDTRRSKIMPGNVTEFRVEDLVPNEQVIVTITKDNYIKRVPVSVYRAQKRGGKGKTGIETKESDTVLQLLIAMTHNNILLFTDQGRVFSSMVYEIPSTSRQSKGQALINFLQLRPNELVTTALCITQQKMDNKKYFFMTTEKGQVKKTLINKFTNVRKTGMIAMKLFPDDKLKWVFPTTGSNEISIITKNGQSVHFNESEVRSMGRATGGVRGIKLRPEDIVISTDVIKGQEAEIFTISRCGYGKRTSIGEFTLQKRGGIGLRAAKISAKTGKLISSKVIYSTDGDAVVVSKKGIVLRTPLKSVKKLSRDTQGVRIIRPSQGDEVASMTILIRYIEDLSVTQKSSVNTNVVQKDPLIKNKIINNKYSQKTKESIFKPYIRALEKKQDIKPTKISTKHFKKTTLAEEKKIKPTLDAKLTTKKTTKAKSSSPNYWGGGIYKKKQ